MVVVLIQYICMIQAYGLKVMVAYECMNVTVIKCLQHGWHCQSTAYMFNAKILCTSGSVYSLNDHMLST